MSDSTTLKDIELPTLVQDPGNYIGGKWEFEPETFAVMNPANDQTLSYLPKSTRATAQRAIAAAGAAQSKWARVPLWDRAAMCNRLASAISTLTMPLLC